MTERPSHRPPSSAWLTLQPPVWVPVLWWCALLASVIASIAGEPAPACVKGQ